MDQIQGGSLVNSVIPFVQGLYQRAISYHQIGELVRAKQLFQKILSFSDTDSELRSQIYTHLATIYLDCHQFSKARKVARAALILNNNDAEAHFLLGAAYFNDVTANIAHAWRHIRQAARLKPQEVTYWLKLAEVALALGQDRRARKALMRAAMTNPSSISDISEIVEGLVELNCIGAARSILLQARYRLKDRQVDQLWQRFQLRFLSNGVEEQRDQASSEVQEPDQIKSRTILPMLRAVSLSEVSQADPDQFQEEDNGNRVTILRHHRFSNPQPHLSVFHRRKGPRKTS